MDILNESAIFKNLQSMFNQDRYWTVLVDWCDKHTVINLSDKIKEHQIKNIFDVLIVEVERQIINFDINNKNGFCAIVCFPDDAIRTLYFNKNSYLRQNMKLSNLFECRLEAEEYLNSILNGKIKEIEDNLNQIKAQTNEIKLKLGKIYNH